MSNIKAVIDSLHSVFADERFKYMNHGGCAVWASIVAKEFAKYGIETHIKVASGMARYLDEPLDEIRPKIRTSNARNWHKHGVYFGHVVLEVEFDGDKWYVDSESLRPARGVVYSDTPVFKGSLPLADAIKLAGTADGWNECYDRKLTPTVRALIKKTMKQLAVPA